MKIRMIFILIMAFAIIAYIQVNPAGGSPDTVGKISELTQRVEKLETAVRLLGSEIDKIKKESSSTQVTQPSGSSPNLGVRILSQSASWTSTDKLLVKGVVVNEGEHDASYVQVVAEYIDENGVVVGTNYSFTNPISLSPGMTGSFTVYLEADPKQGKTYRVRLVK